jgi:calcineurin-like phosphoesterase family protein
LFTVALKKSLHIEPSEYKKADKIFALSDIEGNFDAFRKLLQANNVIDENYNWIFGDGHLVFAGDMFDRGNQVTECLWLVYALEEKAKAAGGHVHFILGNHELMNLQGDHRYVRQKYIENAKLIGQTLAQLYNEDGELGRWLRTKNVMEKIGDVLFIHGGISSRLNGLPITISEINQLARPYYAERKTDYEDERLNIIMSPSFSPFWYRGYYNNKSLKRQIDSTLRKFDVNKIITGHTIVSDTISVHQDGRVINIDTRHAEGKSEALLIERGVYYRVNSEGRKRILFLRSGREDNDFVVD